MPNGLAILLLFVGAGSYSIWQRVRLARHYDSGEFDEQWFQGVFGTGVIMTFTLIFNAVFYLNVKGFEYEAAMSQEIMRPDGTIAQPDPPNLFFGQLEVMLGTYSLVALVWQTVQTKSRELSTRGEAGFRALMAGAIQALLKPAWLAAVGLGSLFGVSAGFGFTDALNHLEVLLGPPLILAVELTFVWLILRFLMRQSA